MRLDGHRQPTAQSGDGCGRHPHRHSRRPRRIGREHGQNRNQRDMFTLAECVGRQDQQHRASRGEQRRLLARRDLPALRKNAARQPETEQRASEDQQRDEQLGSHAD